MSKIKQLSLHEAQKIAAGEVVERPANIVKELIENSIDAGATTIAIYIEDGGKKFIRVVDNGCGMDFTDAQICFNRHATSKITHVHELESINTFGFRGEALASIASISTIELITKEEHSLEGTKVTLNAHTINEISSVACVTGTDISIYNLFDNVPARKKFLKTTQTEWRAIQLLFNAFCFDYPHIHFFLFSDNKQVANCPVTTTLKNRALQLWENSIHNHLLELHVDTDSSLSISGIISDHQHYRYDRSGIYFFVNNRWIKNQHLTSAFIKGYANVLVPGKYPAAAIHITIPTHEVDINIHPRKEEVKFLHPRRVEQALQQAVKTTLENNLSQQLKKNISIKPITSHNSFPDKPFNFDAYNSFLPQPPLCSNWGPHEKELKMRQAIGIENFPPFVVSLSNHTNETNSSPLALPVLQSLGEVGSVLRPVLRSLGEGGSFNAKEDVSKGSSEETEMQPYQIIGQYKATYLLIEKEDGLFLVDQHAAHERILYELFSQRFTDVATIQLLFPHIITLSTHDISIITPHLDIFINNGIVVEQCASDQLIIQSLPVHLKDQSLNDIIKEFIAWIIECTSVDEQTLKKTINNKLQAQMACKAAVKAGNILTHEKMNQLLCDLEKVANRFSCPHGRPTGWLLSLHEIEKKFKRKT
jgi:DNA mismatch repair protein MutL